MYDKGFTLFHHPELFFDPKEPKAFCSYIEHVVELDQSLSDAIKDAAEKNPSEQNYININQEYFITRKNTGIFFLQECFV